LGLITEVIEELRERLKPLGRLKVNWIFDRPRFTPDPPTEWLFAEALTLLGAQYNGAAWPSDVRILTDGDLRIFVSVGPRREGCLNISTPASLEPAEVFQTFDAPIGEFQDRARLWEPVVARARLFVATGPWVVAGRRAVVVRQGVRLGIPFNARRVVRSSLVFFGGTHLGREKFFRSLPVRPEVVRGCFGEERRQKIAETRFVLLEPPIVENYWSNRVYVMANDSAAIISLRRKDLAREFGDAILWIDQPDDLPAALEQDDEPYRIRIWQLSQRRLTYCHRAVELLEAIVKHC